MGTPNRQAAPTSAPPHAPPKSVWNTSSLSGLTNSGDKSNKWNNNNKGKGKDGKGTGGNPSKTASGATSTKS